MFPTFSVHVPAYTHPSGRSVGATDLVVFGAILDRNAPDAGVVRLLTRGEVRAAVCKTYPHLSDLALSTRRNRYDGHLFECDIVPSYCIPTP